MTYRYMASADTAGCSNTLKAPVERNRPLAEVETSESAVELPGPKAGKVVRTFGGAGDRIKAGEPLIVFEVPDNTAGIVGTVPKDEAPTRPGPPERRT
ncbi:biotin/lipoyl-containing protein [Arthrobacter sp. UYEF13]|uniref:biotin/lipoyl-containing protein n=1 Tax=unclassified Pseudarthrobacter TaxID=2647000 RepID=UPI0033973D5D